MTEFLTDPKTLAVAGILIGAASEIIGLNKKWKSNSIIQIVLAAAKQIFKK